MSVAIGYLRRDFLIWSSYRLAAFWQFVALVMLAGIVYFAGSAIGGRSDLIDDEGGSYVAFILVGIAFMDLLGQGLGSLPIAIRDNQQSGTLEPMLLAPITDLTLLLSFWLFRFLMSVVRTALLVSFGVFILDFWSDANLLSVIVVLIPAALTFFAMGAFSAAFVVLVKQGDPVRIAYTAVIAIFGGAFFPVEALPGWIQPVALVIPLTYALSGIREGLSGGPPVDVLPQVIVLSVMALVLMPPGLKAFSWSIERAKREGALGEY
ncbi:MAG TPA: ABC transporter permease [Dehalococcoidia bacterium]|jgi:ABC-2 type transport system permease protein